MVWTRPVLDHLKSKLLVRYSRRALNNGPFDDLTFLDHLNTEQVCDSDHNCKPIEN